MNNFNIGDEVVRTGPDRESIQHGQRCVVSKVVPAYTYICLEDHVGYFDPDYFELVNSSQVKELQARVTELESKVATLQGEWKPVHGGAYWFISATGSLSEKSYIEGYPSDQDRLELGNYFKTEEECQAAAEQVKSLLLGIKSGEVAV